MPSSKEEAMARFDDLEQKLGVRFKDRTLLLRAMTHVSFVNVDRDHSGQNECLAFLGSSVLETVVTERLIRGKEKVGDISKLRAALVNSETLFSVGMEYGLIEAVLMSKGEKEKLLSRPESLVANAVRAIIGALYLDQGIEACGLFAERCVVSRQLEILEACRDYKTSFQEKTQAVFGVGPTYRIVEVRGPEHNSIHVVEALVGDRVWGKGEGKNRKQAENAAAGQALANLEESTSLKGRLTRRIVVKA